MASSLPAIPATWAPEVQSLARIIFGFLLFRHGMEQVLGFPAAFTDYATMSFGGVVKLLAFPGGILIMLGLFTRPVCFVLSPLLLVWWFFGPLQIGLLPTRPLFGPRGPSDPVLLSGFFFLYLALTGPGSWSLDRLLR
ncbi:MAG: DoxX family protein [Acidobacteria bacterium]|nr:DoxX family protein [Acidobacteriota bacterium]